MLCFSLNLSFPSLILMLSSIALIGLAVGATLMLHVYTSISPHFVIAVSAVPAVLFLFAVVVAALC
jgi:hypothetical protein